MVAAAESYFGPLQLVRKLGAAQRAPKKFARRLHFEWQLIQAPLAGASRQIGSREVTSREGLLP